MTATGAGHLRKPGQRIEIRWHHYKSGLGPSKRSRERGSIFYIGEGDFTSAASPFPTFASISHDRADWLSCSEKGASDDATNLACDSHNYIHQCIPFDV